MRSGRTGRGRGQVRITYTVVEFCDKNNNNAKRDFYFSEHKRTLPPASRTVTSSCTHGVYRHIIAKNRDFPSPPLPLYRAKTLHSQRTSRHRQADGEQEVPSSGRYYRIYDVSVNGKKQKGENPPRRTTVLDDVFGLRRRVV